MIKRIYLLYNTLRFLKFIQLVWRIYLKLLNFRSFSSAIQEAIDSRKPALLSTRTKHECYSNEQFNFLNRSYPKAIPMVWNAEEMGKLWLYNLHYFDYLNQPQIERDAALDLINDWIKHNKVNEGCGWEPYPIALRVVNWIKFLSHIDSLEREELDNINKSLFLQSRFLFQHLEYHLLGNHLFKNAVALVFAGVYFKGNEAQVWLQNGSQLLMQQIQEQILADGGHFERSPMYHMLILEDILDCLNLEQATSYLSEPEVALMRDKAKGMLGFLVDIVHQDGEIPFFNDCALKIAPAPGQIIQYAHSLGIESAQFFNRVEKPTAITIIEKPEFGLYVLQNQSGRMIFDAGAIGPDYLPGHAHCDTLSYELSIAGQRCIVNSGTYQYAGEYRNHFRATKAHNTVQIDGVEQHEIWSTFRVARRGYPYEINVLKHQDGISVSACYSGYKKSAVQVKHRRTILCHANAWLITDEILGSSEHLAESFIHLHPNVELTWKSSTDVMGALGNIRFKIIALHGDIFQSEAGLYAPEFGIKQKNTLLVLRKQAFCPFSLSYQIELI